MKLNLRNIDTYYINLDELNERRQITENVLNRLNFTNVTRISGIKTDEGKVGCARSQHKVLSDTSISTPFLLLEDDIRFTGNHAFEIEVPDDADALYLGVSQWARYFSFSGPFLHYRKVDEHIVQVYNMVSGHAVIYLTDEYRQVCSRISKYCGYQIQDHMDNGYAEIQKYYNVYALDFPMFKQSGHNGGVTSTRITDMGIDVSESDTFFDSVKYDLNKLQGVPDLNGCPSTYYPTKIY